MSRELVTLPDAIYTWWFNPIAVNDPDGIHTWVGSIKSGTPAVGELLHTAWRVNAKTGVADEIVLDGLTGPDDHRCVSFAIDADQPEVIAFYTRHNNGQNVRIQKINRTTLETSEMVRLQFSDLDEITYAQILQRGTRIYLITRLRDSNRWDYRVSTDWGQSWSAQRTLFNFAGFGSSYLNVRPDPNNPAVAHMATGPHPPNTTHKLTHYARIDLMTGDITTTAGDLLGNLDVPGPGPDLAPTDMEVVVDPGPDHRTRLLDVGVVDGAPAVAYAIWPGAEGDPIYRVARFDGDWTVADWSVPSGVPFGYLENRKYIGGMALGHGDDTLWTARNEEEGEDTWWYVERWTWNGDGYDLADEIERSTTRLARPYIPWLPGPTEAVYQRIFTYLPTSHFTYEADIVVWGASPDDPPSPDAPGEAIATATIRPEVTWLACDAVTGRIIAEVPGVTVSNVSRLLGAYTSTDATLPIPTVGPSGATLSERARLAKTATLPSRTMIVAVVNDLPAWAGLVVRRVSGSGPSVDMSLVSLEGYFDRRIVRDLTFAQVDQSLIMRDLLRQAEAIDGIGQGLGFDYQVTLSGRLRDRTYLASDRATVYRRARELMGVQDGPEWTVDLDWTDATQTAIRKIVRIGPRIGVAAQEPAAVFETAAHGVFSSAGSSSASYTLTEDYKDGRGANWVEAYAPGEGDDQPSSDPAIDVDALAAGVPIFERHWQPSSSIETQQVLNDHAAAELGRLRHGARLFEIEARWDATPRYGIDWKVGDDIAWDLQGHAHPDGIKGQGRCIGWSLDMAAGLMRPKLLDPTAEGSS